MSKSIQSRLAQILRTAGTDSLVRALSKKFPRSNVYLVGGLVRDLLLGRETKDIDLVITGVPGKKLQQFLKSRGSVNLVGKTFGVFKFVPKGSALPAIDLALPRTDYAFGTGGYRDLTVQTDWKLPIEEDLARRDFTINALAYDLNNRALIDPYGGLRDLRQKRIRAVGNPKVRFREDHSRLLRALRFSCQLNFSIEQKTWLALRASMPKINKKRGGVRVVPHEVIAKELLKAFTANPAAALGLFDCAGAIRALIPELLKMKKCPQPKNYHSEGDVWQHTLLALKLLTEKKIQKEFGEPAGAELALAVLLHDVAKPITITMPKKRGERIRFDGHDERGAAVAINIAERLKLSSYKEERIDIDAERLGWLVRHHLLLISGPIEGMRATTIERYYIRNPELGKKLLALQFADAAATIDPRGRPALGAYRKMRRRITELLGRERRALPPPLLDGYEIMRVLKIKPGPAVGRILAELREAQLQKQVTTKQQARALIRRIHP